jgi:1,4-alpha-glucan branching enzyme
MERVEAVMSLEKKYTKNKTICKVTFMVPKEAAKNAAKVTVAGDFNNWDNTATALKRDKSGNFKVTLELESGKEYQFKYLIDGTAWENDWQADRYVMAGVGNAENSVVAV